MAKRQRLSEVGRQSISSSYQIEFRMIRSRSRHYEAGRVRITGPIDRGFNEFVTLKMSPDAYHRLGRLLMGIGV